MLSSKKIDPYMDFAAGVYLSEAQTPTFPPPYTPYVYAYTVYLFTKGRGERVEPERSGEGQQGRVQITKLG